MKKTNIDKLKLELYQEKLDNGLEIYIIPKNNCNNIYATISTKYGSNIDEFVPIKSKKMKKFPLGIAHFLEHKMFEMEDGTDPFEIYSNNGADANANTSNYKHLENGTSAIHGAYKVMVDGWSGRITYNENK